MNPLPMAPLPPSAAPSERRRVPRVAPLESEVQPQPAQTLQQLKAQARKPGEASFFFFDHHFQHNAVRCYRASTSLPASRWPS